MNLPTPPKPTQLEARILWGAAALMSAAFLFTIGVMTVGAILTAIFGGSHC